MNEALLLLVLVWAMLLLPSALRSRNASPHATVGGFERAMDVLRSESRGSSGGRQVLVPHDAVRIVQRDPRTELPRSDGERRAGAGYVQKPGTGRPSRTRQPDPVVTRRLVWFLRCLAANAITLVVAVVAGGWLWLPFLVCSGLTGAYVAVLRHLKLQRDEARRVVSDLDLREDRWVDVSDAGETRREDAVAVGAEHWVGSGTVRLRRWDD